jgi:ubiquinone/menaquinone biosynthesis C-methylase UbiE
MTVATQKAYIGIGMEGSIARWYDKTTRRDMPEFRKLAERITALLPNGGDVLEVAPGPGFLAVELARSGKVRVTGLDISKTFVEIARTNAKEAGVTVDFNQGNASQMPFADSSFDLIVCRAAFKNFSQPIEALREMHRVLRPGGTSLIIDLRRDVPMTEVNQQIRRWGLGLLNRWFISLTFRFMLLKRAYTMREFEELLRGIGFSKAEVRPEAIGMEVWLEK